MRLAAAATAVLAVSTVGSGGGQGVDATRSCLRANSQMYVLNVPRNQRGRIGDSRTTQAGLAVENAFAPTFRKSPQQAVLYFQPSAAAAVAYVRTFGPAWSKGRMPLTRKGRVVVQRVWGHDPRFLRFVLGCVAG